MAYFGFTFDNTNDGQTFTVLDAIDTSQNPIFFGPVNHGDTSPSIRCGVGDDGRGAVTIQGSRGPLVSFDVDGDGTSLSY